MIQNTRIAPSPTGYFHIGTARTAYHNWLIARATGGQFIVRIDDTDLHRSDDTFTKVIYDGLDWMGLDYDITFRQSDRLDYYKQQATSLLYKGVATYADNGAILFNPSYIPDFWVDSIAGTIVVKQDDIDSIKNMVLIKGDGTPTYNFCSIVDDIDYKINRVIRGTDHIKNTPKQIAIAIALSGKCDIQFTHVGLIHGKDGKKISKRTGALSVTDYKSFDVDPNAFLNFILRMGWSPSDAQFDSKYKKIDKDLAVELINSAGSFKSSPSKFDLDKLNFLNKQFAKKGINFPK